MRFHACVYNFLFPVYLASSLAAISFAPSAVRRNILIGSVIGILAQAPATKYWIAPTAIDIKALAESEEGDEKDEELLGKWNKLSIYRMGFNVIGIGAMLVALIV